MEKLDLRGRDFISTQEWTVNELETILNTAKKMKQNPKKFGNLLDNKTLLMMFYNPSTRTRISFEKAMTDLGGNSIFMHADKDSWSLETGPIGGTMLEKTEHIKDAAKTYSRLVEAVSIRIFPNITGWKLGESNKVVRKLAEFGSIPVINMECDLYHPCQALADIMTIKEKIQNPKKKKFVLTWAYHPKATACSVPDSAALIASRFGMNVTIAHPEGFELDNAIVDKVRKNCEENNTNIEIEHDMEKACIDADVVYPKAWVAPKLYSDMEEEQRRREKEKHWMLDESKMEKAKSDAIFMHCLPIRRNVVATDGVIDGKWSVIYDEAENRLHTQKALLSHIL